MTDENDKAKNATEYDLLVQARKSAIDNAAKLLKAYADVKAVAPKRAGGVRPHTRGETVGRATDALYDLMQLQFAFGNRVAELRGEHGVLAMRALARWYGALTPDESCAHSELTFTGTGKVEQQFTIENKLGNAVSEVTIEWSELRGPRPSPGLKGAITLEIGNGGPKPIVGKESPCTVKVAMGKTCIVTVIVDLDRCQRPESYPRERPYTCRSELHVCMDREVRSIAIVARRNENDKVGSS